MIVHECLDEVRPAVNLFRAAGIGIHPIFYLNRCPPFLLIISQAFSLLSGARARTPAARASAAKGAAPVDDHEVEEVRDTFSHRHTVNCTR